MRRIVIVVCMIATVLTLHAEEDWVPTRIVAITEYPPRALQVRIMGDVVIQCFLDSTGSVVKAEIVSGHSFLTGQARENALLWKFRTTTAARDGSDSVTLKYRYHLESVSKSNGHTSFSVDLPNVIQIGAQITPPFDQ